MEQIEELVEIFKALSDPTRLRLVKLLGDHQGALCVNALAHQLVLFHTTDLDFCGARKPEKSAKITTEIARKHSECSRARWAKARLCFVKGH